MSKQARRLSRAKVDVSLVTAAIHDGQLLFNGEQTYSGFLREPAYVTPRFPHGIGESALAEADAIIQRETVAFWFLANFEPATGTYFGFAEAVSKNPTDPGGATTVAGVPIAQAPRVGGFNQGTCFDGGRAEPLLLEEFGGHVPSEVVAKAASLFGGLWHRVPPDTAENAPTTADEARASLGVAVDAFETLFRAFAPEHGAIGHNGPPDDPVTSVEREIVLRAVSDMRLAVSTGADPSVLEAVWAGVAAVTARFGAWTLGQLGVFFNNFTPEAGKSLGARAPMLVAGAVLWYAGAHLSDLLQLALKLAK